MMLMLTLVYTCACGCADTTATATPAFTSHNCIHRCSTLALPTRGDGSVPLSGAFRCQSQAAPTLSIAFAGTATTTVGCDGANGEANHEQENLCSSLRSDPQELQRLRYAFNTLHTINAVCTLPNKISRLRLFLGGSARAATAGETLTGVAGHVTAPIPYTGPIQQLAQAAIEGRPEGVFDFTLTCYIDTSAAAARRQKSTNTKLPHMTIKSEKQVASSA